MIFIICQGMNILRFQFQTAKKWLHVTGEVLRMKGKRLNNTVGKWVKDENN